MQLERDSRTERQRWSRSSQSGAGACTWPASIQSTDPACGVLATVLSQARISLRQGSLRTRARRWLQGRAPSRRTTGVGRGWPRASRRRRSAAPNSRLVVVALRSAHGASTRRRFACPVAVDRRLPKCPCVCPPRGRADRGSTASPAASSRLVLRVLGSQVTSISCQCQLTRAASSQP
jgi:hypothetical protein